jgi:hypothetical protein
MLNDDLQKFSEKLRRKVRKKKVFMEWKVIKTKDQYSKAVKRAMEIFQVPEGSPEADELELLLVLVKDYEDKYIAFRQ